MRSSLRLGVLATHPIQYHAPLYRRLAAAPGVELTVYYAHRPDAAEQGVGFGVPFTWDVDLLSGYEYGWLTNVASRPSASDFFGCDTPEIADRIRRDRFDAFLVAGWHSKTYWQAMNACRAANVPLMVRGDSQLDCAAPWAKRVVKRLLYPHLMRLFSVCLSVGRRSEEYFRHFGARRIVRSPHFVDNAFFAAAADQALVERDARRASWGAAPDTTVALFAGKLVPKKRPNDLVMALRRLRERDVMAVFVGDGTLRGECEAAASAGGVRARFAGFRNQTEIPHDYAAADVLVLPSDARETWGLVVNEAMACGTPAIVSRAAGCAPDLILEGETGFSFALGAVGELADKLARIVDDRAAAAEMGARARQHVQSYSVDAAADGVLEAAYQAARLS